MVLIAKVGQGGKTCFLFVTKLAECKATAWLDVTSSLSRAAI